MADVVDSRIVLLLVSGRKKVNQTVKSDAGHDVDEKTVFVSERRQE